MVQGKVQGWEWQGPCNLQSVGKLVSEITHWEGAKGGSCQGEQDKRHGSKVPKGLNQMSDCGLQTRDIRRELIA